MTFLEVAPALIILFAGTAFFALICLRFPPALALGVVAYSMISKTASVAYVETVKVYLIEVGMFSFLVGATPRLIFYNLLIFMIALGVIRWTVVRQRATLAQRVNGFGSYEYNRELQLALVVGAALLALQIANALASPPYALPGSSVNRHQFWTDIRFPLIADLVGNLVIFVPAVSGVALAYAKITEQPYFRRFSIGLMLAYAFFCILSGARFNAPLMALLFWLSSYWTVLWVVGRKLYIKRMGLLVTSAVAVFLVVGYLEIADRGIARMTGSAWNGLLYRVFALQGNVSFAADVLTSEGRTQPISLLLEDMTTTVRTYMPSRLAEAYLYKGVNLAGSLPGNSIYVFGYWLGMAPMILYAILLGLTVSAYTYIVASGRFMLIFPSSYLCLWAYTGYTQGSFSPFLDYKFPLFIALMILWLLAPHRSKPRRRPAPGQQRVLK